MISKLRRSQAAGCRGILLFDPTQAGNRFSVFPAAAATRRRAADRDHHGRGHALRRPRPSWSGVFAADRFTAFFLGTSTRSSTDFESLLDGSLGRVLRRLLCAAVPLHRLPGAAAAHPLAPCQHHAPRASRCAAISPSTTCWPPPSPPRRSRPPSATRSWCACSRPPPWRARRGPASRGHPLHSRRSMDGEEPR